MPNTMISKSPPLRFPEYSGEWMNVRIDSVLKRENNPVSINRDTNYQEIGIRSHGKGIFHKSFETGRLIGNKRVFWVKPGAFIVNIVFAWEQAVAITSENEDGMIASHRFPMYLPKNNLADTGFILRFFLRPRGKYLLGLASPGGAGRNKTLGQNAFNELKIIIPAIEEQQKIATFISKVDEWINNLKLQKKSLQSYKSGVVHSIFSQAIRFKDINGILVENWSRKRLEDLLEERLERNRNKEYNEVFSVAKGVGVVNQIEHLGRSYSSEDLSNYKVVDLFDIVYTKSPTADFPFGIIKQNKTGRKGLVSTLYAVYKPKNRYIGALIHEYFLSWTNTYNYLNPLVRKGAKNTMNISNTDFLKGKLLSIPTSEIEQIKITELMTSIDMVIDIKQKQILEAENWKKGLLQQMFV